MVPFRKSFPWNYFNIESEHLARCVICQKTYKLTKNTSNLRSHLKRMHNQVLYNITNETRSLVPQVEPSTSGIKPPPSENRVPTLNSQSVAGCSFQTQFPIAGIENKKDYDLTVGPYQKVGLGKRSSKRKLVEEVPFQKDFSKIEVKKNKFAESALIEIDLTQETPFEKETFCKNANESKEIIKEKKSEIISTASTSNQATFISSRHYQELLSLSDQDVVKNAIPFECSICLSECACGDGVLLKECLHSFCKECLSDTIKYCQDAEVKCPYMDNQYHCDCTIQEREIKALLEKSLYEQFLNRSVSIAENRMKNTFHCKTPDCKGWCIYDENVTCFVCPVCGDPNCINCKAIHRGMNCKEYQEFGADAGVGLQTKKMLDEMVRIGDAMACPSCQIILTKILGCDWLCCTMCKTEVCWATKKPRRGPGGCKCSPKKRCHPKCNNCH